MEAEKKQILNLENRERFSVGAVENVESFSEEMILLKTSFGNLCVCGKGLRLEDLSTENGNVLLTGRIDKMEFSEVRQKHSFFRDIFR